MLNVDAGVLASSGPAVVTRAINPHVAKLTAPEPQRLRFPTEVDLAMRRKMPFGVIPDRNTDRLALDARSDSGHRDVGQLCPKIC